MDSQLLSELGQHIVDELPHIRSVLIVRHGHRVFEEYYQGLDEDDLHQVASVTKSFTSALIGIALQEGYLETLNQRMIDFFPEYATLDIDPRVSDITLGHLLTMTSGFRWNDSRAWTWMDSEDWIAYALGRPIAHEPGQRFNYDTPSSHLLSGVITKETGMTALEFADEHLFGPLGISERQWPTDPQGYSAGGHAASFRTRDLAKLGYLYLNWGVWDGRQIVPAPYVEESTREQSEGGPPEGERYGYLWWITTVEGYAAYFAGGYGGQFIYIVPDQDIVVVITSNVDRSHIENRGVVGEFIIPAILG